MYHTPRSVAGVTSAAPAPEERWGAAGIASALLRFPLFHKILLAHAALVLVVAVASTTIAVEILHTGTWRTALGMFLLVACGAAAVTLPVNALVLRLALGPLETLEQTAERVEAGHLEARADASLPTDPRLARLIAVFNRLLDGVSADRRRLREVAARAVQAQDAELTRIARELQEETVQTLSALLLRLRVARQAREGAARDAMLDELRRDLVEITDRLRGFARTLHTPTLADLGVGAAVEAYARTMAESGELRIAVDAANVRGLLGQEAQIAAYRVVQEALSNAVLHSGACEARVTVRHKQGWVEVEVADDGRGFDPVEMERTAPCLGLFAMHERALSVGGDASVESAPGSGTVVRLRVPTVEAAEPAGGPLLATGTAATM